VEKFTLQKIDESLQEEHLCLESTDKCYFFGEYTGRQGYSPMNKKGEAGWHYKDKEVVKIAKLLMSTKGWSKLKGYTWVPMPPSKIKLDPAYDDRLLRVLSKIKETEKDLDVRELLVGKASREPAHDPNSQKRPKISDHLKNFELDQLLKTPTPKAIAIFDDVITTGASFKAAQSILQEVFPKIPIVGIFIARNRILPPDAIKIIDENLKD
jgi:hypothetical protein